MENSTPKEPGYDVMRDSFIRYAGYANEVGEAFRPIFAQYVAPSYAIAFGYVGIDTALKMKHSYQAGESGKQVVVKGMDAFLWQTLASVLIPGKTIHLVTYASTKLLAQPKLPAVIPKYGPTAIGLGIIPFIVHPIDRLVDNIMDATYRKWLE